MYCNKCGKEYSEGSAFCANCGNALISEKQPKKKITINKKLLLSIIAFMLALCTLFTIISITSSKKSNTPEDVAADFVIGLIGFDTDTLVGCIPQFVKNSFIDRYDLSFDTSDEDLAQAIKENEQQESVNIEILNCEIDEQLDIYDTWEYLSDMYSDDFDYSKEISLTTEVVNVKVTCIIEEQQELYLVTCIKMDDIWYAVDID